MPELLDPKLLATPGASDPIDDHEAARAINNRSPHPYHHQNSELPYASHRFLAPDVHADVDDDDDAQYLKPTTRPRATSYPSFSKESTPASDSGTEADDEHFLKGLPAPKVRLHKGVRGQNEVISRTSTPLPSPAIRYADEGQLTGPKTSAVEPLKKGHLLEALRRQRLLVRRVTELGIVATLGVFVATNRRVAPIFAQWSQDYQCLGALYAVVLLFNVLRRAASISLSSAFSPFRLSSSFDPAPILYPSAIPLYVSLLISTDNQAVLLPNIILSLCSIPPGLVPRIGDSATFNNIHWALACLPVFLQSPGGKLAATSTSTSLSSEALVLLYPLHYTLCDVLHYLTTTSLLTTELHLLSIALINVLILATSPQVRILKALLWIGGLGILVSCSTVIQWEVALARVPKWRFKRLDYQKRVSLWKRLTNLLTWRKIQYELVGPTFETADYDGAIQEDESPVISRISSRAQTMGPAMDGSLDANSPPSSPSTGHSFAPIARSQTISSLEKSSRKAATHTASGRKKRSTSISVRPYLKFTQTQAVVRKWVYAAYIYIVILAVIFVGVRTYIERFALKGEEPLGWGLGYAFGDLPWFRFQVVNANLERWICLPSRTDPDADRQCGPGWVQRLRHNDFGEANTRLIISGYWVGILTVGLLIVFRLSNMYEVDTRRKVFHFMMVGMFLPATFVDPAFAALCLSLALAIFLILDLIRASQLPPLSKPIASFLAPYVDGRDFRGPVVISHIFLLIGCAIPLWLALASLPRTGTGYQAGWEIPTREVSMVAGVICVGLGDAAASLIGRRYGHHKWLWGGGKSLEGSVAFALAVFVGLGAASAWLRIGGWPVADETSVLGSARNAAVCGSMASLTEAVLTGGNDNVIVPVILWTCVKGLGV